jgi:hypothetical protein
VTADIAFTAICVQRYLRLLALIEY